MDYGPNELLFFQMFESGCVRTFGRASLWPAGFRRLVMGPGNQRLGEGPMTYLITFLVGNGMHNEDVLRWYLFKHDMSSARTVAHLNWLQDNLDNMSFIYYDVRLRGLVTRPRVPHSVRSLLHPEDGEGWYDAFQMYPSYEALHYHAPSA